MPAITLILSAQLVTDNSIAAHDQMVLLARHATDNGLFTGDTDAELLGWSVTVAPTVITMKQLIERLEDHFSDTPVACFIELDYEGDEVSYEFVCHHFDDRNEILIQGYGETVDEAVEDVWWRLDHGEAAP